MYKKGVALEIITTIKYLSNRRNGLCNTRVYVTVFSRTLAVFIVFTNFKEQGKT